jgi:hypothetical protein
MHVTANANAHEPGWAAKKAEIAEKSFYVFLCVSAVNSLWLRFCRAVLMAPKAIEATGTATVQPETKPGQNDRARKEGAWKI